MYIFLVNLLVGSGLVWGGYLIYYKKKHYLIAGYNDMNSEQKKRVNIERLSKSLKITLYFIGISIAVIPSALYLIGYENWGISYPLIIIPGVIYYLTISILSIKWKI